MTPHKPESVWDYPRPPAVRVVDQLVEIDFGGETIARADCVVHVLETSHPPTYYLPRDAFNSNVLAPTSGTTLCEFKGVAHYFDVVVGDKRAKRAAWEYRKPAAGFEALTGHIAIMPAPMDECRVNGETVQAQDGDFYGGWITSAVTGPFKGAPGTLNW